MPQVAEARGIPPPYYPIYNHICNKGTPLRSFSGGGQILGMVLANTSAKTKRKVDFVSK